MGVLTIETDVEQLVRDERYKISGCEIGRDTIILYVTEMNIFQEENPKIMYGRDVQIFKSI